MTTATVEKPTSLINPDPFCPVQMAMIEHRGQTTDKYLVEIFNPVTGQYQPIPGTGVVHADNYRLVPNKEVHDAAQAVMERSGCKFEPIPTFGHGHSKSLDWDGRKYNEKWVCRDTHMTVKGRNDMMMGLEIRNSYDGSSKVSLAFFALRVVCANQFYSTNMMGQPFQFPHTYSGGQLGDDFESAVQRIEGQAESFARIAPRIEQLQAAHVSDFQEFLNLRSKIKSDTGVEFRDKQFLDELSGCGVTAELGLKDVRYDDPSSYWDIANAYTALTTHSVGGIRGADHSDRVVNWLLNSVN